MKSLRQITVRPTLEWSLKQAAARYEGRFLTRADYDQLIRANVLGVLPSGDVKFLFLTNVIPPRLCAQTYAALGTLGFDSVRTSFRGALRGVRSGEHMVMGYLRHKISRLALPAAANDYDRTVYCDTITPLAELISGIVKEHLPEYWREQERKARHNARQRIGRTVFSTVTINRTVCFPSHTDGQNTSGLAALMAFGRFAGGDLCLPRLRVAFRLRPGNLLIADNHSEQHGNIGPIAGDRISLVYYLRDLR